MQRLIEHHYQVLKDLPTSFVRDFMKDVHWEERLIGIKGAKGVGKTTLVLQYLKRHLQDQKSIYFSLDNSYFFGNSISETVEEFIRQGYTCFFLDEVHKHPVWSSEIKGLYDTYRKVKIVFTGSSVLSLVRGAADLSRRAMMYDMPGLSFREYLEVTTGIPFRAYQLGEILENHPEIARKITSKLKPFEYFDDYLKQGYFPFFIETPATYRQRVEAAVNQTLESDLPLIRNISPDAVIKLKRILAVIAESAPFKPNIQKISERVGVSRNSLVLYMRFLEEAKIINQLYTSVSGIGSLQKPQKIYFENSNLVYTLSDRSHKGTIRETFVLNQLVQKHKVTYPGNGDFLVDDAITLEVGGKDKTRKQISGIENAHVIADGIEIGLGNRIPIWLMGFLY